MEQTLNKLPLKYQGYAIVLQEVPDEITLAFNISGCTHHCDGCHSPNLWEYEGEELIKDLNNVIEKYNDYISCVCFMGGDQNIEELKKACLIVKNQYSLKTCIYSGSNTINIFQDMIHKNLLDYLKIGQYKKEKGGLNKPTTNQRMYKIEGDNLWDITSKFQKIKEDVI